MWLLSTCFCRGPACGVLMIHDVSPFISVLHLGSVCRRSSPHPGVCFCVWTWWFCALLCAVVFSLVQLPDFGLVRSIADGKPTHFSPHAFDQRLGSSCWAGYVTMHAIFVSDILGSSCIFIDRRIVRRTFTQVFHVFLITQLYYSVHYSVHVTVCVCESLSPLITCCLLICFNLQLLSGDNRCKFALWL